jgi:hypothetical protein
MNLLLTRNRAALLALVTGLAGVFANIAVGSLPDEWKAHLWLAWIPFVLSTLLTVVLSLPADDERNYERRRRDLLTIVRSQTQQELREKLRYPAHARDPQADYRLTLGVEPRPDLLPRSALRREHPDAPPLPIPSGTPIVQVFDDSGRSLLIVGEPGAGKSTLLLELALALAGDPTANPPPERIPVVLNLASWAQRSAPLAEWLVEALETRYGVGRSVGQRLVAGDALIPLLDGLDELDVRVRGECAAAIATFVARTATPLAVCSRVKEYAELAGVERPGRTARELGLREAVCVQPLEQAQVEAYLASHGTALAGLAHAWRSLPALRSLLTTPLMLNVAAFAFDSTPPSDVPATDADDLRRQLWHSYVRRVLTRPGAGTTDATTLLRRLRWLARAMAQRNLTTLYIERMQPGWLPPTALRAYRQTLGLASGLASGLAAGLAFGLAFGLALGLAVGLAGGLALGLDEAGLFEVQSGARFNWRAALVVGLAGGLAFGLTAGLAFGLAAGLALGLLGGQGTTRTDPEAAIAPAEVARWSWSDFLSGGLAVGLEAVLTGGLAGGLAAGLAAGLVGGLAAGLAAGLVGLMVGLASGLAAGLATTGWITDQIDERGLTRPNEGMRRSAGQALRAAFTGGLTGALVGFVALQFNGLLDAAVGVMLPTNLAATLAILGTYFGAWSSGGRAYLRHLALRWALWRHGLGPWRYDAFLEEASSRLLLRRVGGGYEFWHRELRDFLAEDVTPRV